MTGRSTQALRALVVAATLLLLVALVALASGNERPAPEQGTPRALELESLDDIVLTIAATLYVLLVVFAIVVLYQLRGRDLGPGARGTWKGLITFGICVFALWCFVFFEPERARELFERLRLVGDRAGSLGSGDPTDSASETGSPVFVWPIALLVVAVAGSFILWFWYRRRPQGTLGPLPPPRLEHALAEVVERTIGDLRAERDPRRAVIAAYAQMERVLGDHGHPRRHYEAPFEYLARILQELRVRAASALALTELFERARFSQHVVDEEMKDEAIGALEAVRADLRAAT